MGFKNYDNAKLVKTVKSLKTILIVFVIIWLAIIAFLIATQIYTAQKGDFNISTIIPFLVGPITLLPIYINYQNAKKEFQSR